MRRALLSLAAVLTSLIAREARANGCDAASGVSTCIDADNLWPHAGQGPFFTLGSTATTPAGQVAFGLVGTYLKRPIGLGVASADPGGSAVFAVDDRFDATLLFALGVADRLELTLAAPATLYQSGAGLTSAVSGSPALVRSAVRDFRFGFALAIIPRPRVGEPRGLALTGRFELGVPVGAKAAFTSAPSAVAVPSLVLDVRLGRVLLAAEAFARVRAEAQLADAVVGTQIGGALGVSVDALPDRWLTVAAEAFALPTVSKQQTPPFSSCGGEACASAKPLVPAEWMASVSTAHLLGGDVTFSVGAGGPLPFVPHALTAPAYRLDFGIRYAPTGRDTDGDGVLDRDDKCPTLPEDRDGFEDADGCPDPDDDKDGIPDALDKCRNEPEDKNGFEDADGCPDAEKLRASKPSDRDGDGIVDDQDQCPDEPEDRDGFQDQDGCPDPDNDQDGVADAQDRCPGEPETIDGYEDADGCPEPGRRSLVRWDGDRVIVDAPARFDRGKATLPPALLAQVKLMAQLVRGRAPLGSVIVETFADRADDTSVRAAELAGARAAAVKKALVEAGVPEALVTAVAGEPQKRAANAPTFDLTARRKSRGRSAPKRGDSVRP